MEISGRDVGLGIALGAAGLFVGTIWPVVVDVEKRTPVAYGPPGEQSAFDALMTLWIAFGAMAYTIDATTELAKGGWRNAL